MVLETETHALAKATTTGTKRFMPLASKGTVTRRRASVLLFQHVVTRNLPTRRG
jgi:hypothetical protein